MGIKGEKDGDDLRVTPKTSPEPLLSPGGIVNEADDKEGTPYFVGAQNGTKPNGGRIYPRGSGSISDGRRGET